MRLLSPVCTPGEGQEAQQARIGLLFVSCGLPVRSGPPNPCLRCNASFWMLEVFFLRGRCHVNACLANSTAPWNWPVGACFNSPTQHRVSERFFFFFFACWFSGFGLGVRANCVPTAKRRRVRAPWATTEATPLARNTIGRVLCLALPVRTWPSKPGNAEGGEHECGYHTWLSKRPRASTFNRGRCCVNP